MKGLGFILCILGLISTIYGLTLNNNLQAQFTAMINSGSANPGTLWIMGGLVALVIGFIMIFTSSDSPS